MSRSITCIEATAVSRHELQLEIDLLSSPAASTELAGEEKGYFDLSILIADREADLRAYIRQCLQLLDAGVLHMESASDGRSVRAALEERQFDLFICGMLAPEMDERELCTRLRRDGAITVPVLLITSGMGETESVEHMLRCHADAVLPKPFNAGRLCDQVKSLLNLQ